MTLEAAIEATLPRLRAEAEAMMTLTLTAYAPTGETTTDADGYEVPEYESEGETRGKVQADSGKDDEPRYVSIGGVDHLVMRGGLHIPISAPLPVASEQRGQAWEYVITALGTLDDPALLNRRYMAVGVPAKSKATARRLDVVEV